MPPVGFAPIISAGELPQIYAFDRAATATGNILYYLFHTCVELLCIYTETSFYNVRHYSFVHKEVKLLYFLNYFVVNTFFPLMSRLLKYHYFCFNMKNFELFPLYKRCINICQYKYTYTGCSVKRTPNFRMIFYT